MPLAEQFDVALAKVLQVVKAGGAAAEHITRMTIYVTDLDAYRASRAALNPCGAATWIAITRPWRWCRSAGSSTPAPPSKSRRRRRAATERAMKQPSSFRYEFDDATRVGTITLDRPAS